MKDVLLAFIAIIPTTATALSTIYLNKQRKSDRESQERRDARADAKSSIQNMITQDIIRAEILGRMPENRTDIEDEYERYHNNGGNGEITRQVREYNDWIEQFVPSKDNPNRVAQKARSLNDHVFVSLDRDAAQEIKNVLAK